MSRYSFVLLAVLLGMGAEARAQEGSASGRVEPPGYKEAIRAAIQEYDSASYTEAREQFRRAHALFPNARTLRGLGVAEYELHDYPRAIGYLEQALASSVKPLEAGMRAETQALLERAKGYVGEVRIELEPSEARVTLDGERLEEASGKPLLLAIGDHLLEASATGYLSERRVLRVDGGQKRVAHFKLVAIEASAPAASASAPVQEERPTAAPLYKRWWLWTGVALVAGGITAGVLYATRTETTREVPRTTGNTPSGATALSPFTFGGSR